jgi:hypothetical protein
VPQGLYEEALCALSSHMSSGHVTAGRPLRLIDSVRLMGDAIEKELYEGATISMSVLNGTGEDKFMRHWSQGIAYMHGKREIAKR